MKKITTILLLFIGLNASAQFLSFNKTEIIYLLGKTNYSSGAIINGETFIYVPELNGCSFTYSFDKNGICKKETVRSSNPAVVELIMDLDNTYYIRIGDVYWREQSYGLVEVKRVDNTFTYALK